VGRARHDHHHADGDVAGADRLRRIRSDCDRALISAVVLGFMVAANNISVNTAIQLHSEPRYRGRINSLYNMIFKGGPAISAAVFGWLANLTDIRFASVAAAGALIFTMFSIVRQTTIVRVIGSASTKLRQSA
jgi:MFS family permease